LLGFLLGVGEFIIVGKNPLIQDFSILNLLSLTIIMVFFVSPVEEMIFRSILQNRLETVLGIRKSLVIVSILFGLMHSGYGDIYETLYITLVGLFIGYLFYRTRSLPLVSLIHGVMNVFFFGIIPLLL
jgi:membrane protease YdiL (CAAX protease family)